MLLLVPIIIVWGILETIFNWIVNFMVAIILIAGMIMGLFVIALGGVIYSIYAAVKRVKG
jgi:hypothetical protein